MLIDFVSKLTPIACCIVCVGDFCSHREQTFGMTDII
jgi:hypothetical protein